ncbi:sodium channel and clathrin linker 1 isoform X3 [Zootoca vivipara]|uniref:sodium channel and clathrin linker 1 isoform X3 n=1 Tax=Zootoca vivipara TaxID=8524 RepID=UPI00293C0864|nr:sodium channel and clathrin linker 1 isoform X3 [Zootoca vivipara]XP_034969956.2 sodium channel and clathrin linker 1 isoform X3 [Zootoca vivipara]
MERATDFPRDQNQRLNDVPQQLQTENLTRTTFEQKNPLGGNNEVEPELMNQRLSPLAADYDGHLKEMNEQLRFCQVQMRELRLKLEQVTKENERLHEELKEAVEKQLEALQAGPTSGDGTFMDENIIRNLQDQLQLANKEKEHAVELWQTVSQELERLQQIYHAHMTEAQIHIAESQKQKDQLTSFQQLTKQLHFNNEKTESLNQVFKKTVTEQNVELDQLRKEQRQSKLDLRTAAAKVDEMTRLIENLQAQVERKEEEVLAAQEREEASDKRLHQLQSSIKELEKRLCVAAEDLKELRTEKTNLEKQIQELNVKCTVMEREKNDAMEEACKSIQLLEEANLQKSQAMICAKQKEEEIENMKEAFSHLLQDAASSTRKEVENEKKRCNIQISRLAEEIDALQKECEEKQIQIERSARERQTVEEELEKVYREGRGNEGDSRKLEELYQRCLIAELAKDDLQRSLQTAQNKIKQLEMNYEEQRNSGQEMIYKLQSILESERKNCGSVSEERLKLQQENEQFQKEMEELRKLAVEAQQAAKLKISIMENEHIIKEHGSEVRLKEMEDVHRKSTAELRRLLIAQQKATNRWKEETKKLTEATESRINSLKSELSRQKIHTQEILCQLERANEKVIENEKLMMEHQEKVNRLQRRLSQAEERATTASQQLSVITMQRKKAASLIELENT